MRFTTLTAMSSCAILLLAACETTGPMTAPNPTPASTEAVDQDDFDFPNARILSRISDDTVLVEVRGLPNIAPNTAQLRAAGRRFCGGDVIIGLPVSTNRMRFNTIRQYLVRCQ